MYYVMHGHGVICGKNFFNRNLLYTNCDATHDCIIIPSITEIDVEYLEGEQHYSKKN